VSKKINVSATKKIEDDRKKYKSLIDFLVADGL
jgi:hypothetical protein